MRAPRWLAAVVRKLAATALHLASGHPCMPFRWLIQMWLNTLTSLCHCRDIHGRRSEIVLRSLWQTLLMNILYGLSNPRIDNWCAGSS